MRRLPIGQFVKIGLTLRYFHGVNAGTPTAGPNNIVEQAAQLDHQLADAKCTVTRALCKPLFETVTRLRTPDAPSFLDDAIAARCRELAASAEQTLLAEASQLNVFVAADTRWSTEDLFDNVARLFGTGVYPGLQPLSQRDVAEAARCLVCERPTASAFHILRATEGELRSFYASCVKRGRIPEPRHWGPIVTHLRGLRKAPPNELLDILDHIRRSFRNPTQHPEAEYTLDQAQDLFALCSDAISRMISHVNH